MVSAACFSRGFPSRSSGGVGKSTARGNDTTAGGGAEYDGKGGVLVLGDGDFSFSRGLLYHIRAKLSKKDAASAAKNIVATSYETQQDVVGKYGGKAKACIAELQKEGAEVKFSVDARKLENTFKPATRGQRKKGGKKERARKRRRVSTDASDAGAASAGEGDPDEAAEAAPSAPSSFARIVFNFPHTGQQMAHLNRAMLRAFFLSAEPLLRDAESEVHVSLKLKFPYTSWDAKESAEAAGLLLHDRLEFDAGSFRGYVHRTTRADATTAGVKDRDKRHCKTFVFRRNPDGKPAVDSALAGWGVTSGGGGGGSSGGGGGGRLSFLGPHTHTGGGGLKMMAPTMQNEDSEDEVVAANQIHFGKPGGGSGGGSGGSSKKEKKKSKKSKKKGFG